MVVTKSFARSNNVVYGMNNGSFNKLTEEWDCLTNDQKKSLFLSASCEMPSAAALATLGKFKVLMYNETENKPVLIVMAVPKDQLVLPRRMFSLESFEGIDKVTPIATVSTNATCSIIVTIDNKAYQTYDFAMQEWKPIDHTDLAAVKTSGIPALRLETLARTAWDALTVCKSGIGFAYLLAIEAATDSCIVEKLDLQVDMREVGGGTTTRIISTLI